MPLARAYLLLSLLTLALFAFANLRSPLVNEDGVLYLLLAERIGNGELASAVALFNRPFYPSLIAALHSLGGLGLQQSAWCIDAAFAVLLAVAFAEFCRLLYGDNRVLPWAALLILAHPKINNYFGFVFRDTGYWALLLLSFCAWLRHLAEPRAHWLAAWALCTLLASALRPEALLFGLLLPPLLLCGRGSPRAPALAQALLALGLTFGLLAAALLLAAGRPETQGGPLRATHEVPVELWRELPSNFRAAAARYASEVLDPHSRDVATLSLAGGLATILVAKILNGLGPLQCLLLALGARGASLLPPRGRRLPWALMLAGSLLVAAAFVAYRQFLDTRYVMLACLLLLAPAARGLQWLFAAAAARGRAQARMFVAAALLLFGLDLALGLDRPKPYLNECAAWLRANLPPGSPAFSNDKQLAWAGRTRWDWQTTQDANVLIAERRAPLLGSTYWIVHIKRGQPELAAQLDRYRWLLRPLHRCEDPRGSAIEIFAPYPVP